MSNMPKHFMEKAFALAQHINPHLTAPNPRVGCVIVNNGKIVAEGVHEKYGNPHAEQMAFTKLKKQVNIPHLGLDNLEIYITLEPCDHFHGKKTPSCTDLLINTKPQKIYVGSLDPHFQGKNIKKIRKAGIAIEVLDNNYHEQLNPFFKKYITTKKPYITLKVAQSLDGKISSKLKVLSSKKRQEPEIKYITNKKSLEKVHEMRAKYSAILTTTQTILDDNPQMNIRLKKTKNHTVTNPSIIIVGKSTLPKTLKIFQIPDRKVLRFDTFHDFWKSEEIEKIDAIMTECGTTLNTYLLSNNLVDEIDIFIAPKIIGGKNVESFKSYLNLDTFRLEKTENLEGNLLLKFIKK